MYFGHVDMVKKDTMLKFKLSIIIGKKGHLSAYFQKNNAPQRPSHFKLVS